MKLVSVTAVAKVVGATFGQNESVDARVARMQAFWKAPENAILYSVGKLLAQKADATRTLADVMVTGEEIELSSVNLGGKELPLVPGFAMSLANAVKVWACPACRSAHGSKIYPSQILSASNLAKNNFYYRPSDKALFVISDTCWSDYVVKLKAAKPERFLASVPALVPVPAQGPAPQKGGKS